MNDRPIVTATVRADAPINLALGTWIPELVVRCQTPLRKSGFPEFLPDIEGLAIFITTGGPALVENAEGKHTIFVRFDDGEARQWGSSEATDRKALMFAPALAVQLVALEKRLATASRMRVRFTPFNASPVTATFDLRGFDLHIDKVLSACPTFDPSKWKVPPGLRP